MIYYRDTIHLGPALLLTPVFVAQTAILVMGAGMLLAALNVRYRDVKYTIPFVTQIGLFVSPVIYPISFFPPRYQAWLALNPMTGIIEGFRACLLDVPVNWQLVGVSWLVTLVILLLGGLHFRSTERVFADIV
jgi:lipopolysaccharide transport system permease protein